MTPEEKTLLDNFEDDLKELIERYCQDRELSVGNIVGVLEVRKTELIGRLLYPEKGSEY